MKTIFLYFISFYLIFLTGCNSCEYNKTKHNNNFIYGKVVKIYDGDTYQLLTDDYQNIKIRMEGIDAPEREMPFHSVSRKYLSDLIFKKEVKFRKTGEDVHGRSLGFTYLMDNTDVNLKMLEAGMVWHFKRYNNNSQYADAEIKAKALQLGLWQEENPTAPWSYRNKK